MHTWNTSRFKEFIAVWVGNVTLPLPDRDRYCPRNFLLIIGPIFSIETNNTGRR